MSRNTPPCGEPRPSTTSRVMARATTSRVSSSGGRRFFSESTSQRSASSTVSAVSAANFSGMYLNMKRSPSRFFSTPPSPRTPSVTRMPRTEGGHTMPVGWNWVNSMSISSAPGVVGQREAVAGVLPGVGGEAPGAAATAGGDDHGAGLEEEQPAGLAPVRQHPGDGAAVEQQRRARCTPCARRRVSPARCDPAACGSSRGRCGRRRGPGADSGGRRNCAG